MEVVEVAIVLLEEVLFKALHHLFTLQLLVRMFVNFSKFLLHYLVFFGPDLFQIEVCVPLLIMRNKVRVTREVLEAYLALKNLNWKPLRLLEHGLIGLKRLLLELEIGFQSYDLLLSVFHFFFQGLAS